MWVGLKNCQEIAYFSNKNPLQKDAFCTIRHIAEDISFKLENFLIYVIYSKRFNPTEFGFYNACKLRILLSNNFVKVLCSKYEKIKPKNVFWSVLNINLLQLF